MTPVTFNNDKENMISLCIIALNEEKYLKGALQNTKGYFNETVIIDGGSTDSTLSIAHEFTENVFTNKFNNDFSEQRNFAISKCTNPWVFMLDADERLEQNLLDIIGDLVEFNKLIDLFIFPRINTIVDLDNHPELITMYGWNIDNKKRINYPDLQGRLFKNKKDIYWVNKVHEKLTGYKSYSVVEGYHIIHEKDYLRQTKQNLFYSTLV
jgi:glycosyltransferase involved in cell wall biosynthesis